MTNSTPDPSVLFNDSIALFTQSATQAFNDLQSQTRSEVAQAEADARQARNERDQALKSLQEFQKEAQKYKDQILEHKAALKEAELTIRHLQREATQWKDQARNWQEHFLRVEQERCSLTSRMDELVTERLTVLPITPKHSTSASAPSTCHPSIPRPPTYQPSNALNASSSSESPTVTQPNRPTKTPRYKANAPRLSELPSYSAAVQTPHTTTKKPAATSTASRGHPKGVPATPSNSKNTAPDASAAELQQPRQVLIRRVHAVVKVKQEEDDEEPPLEPPEEAEVAPTPRRSRRSRQIVDDDDDDDDDDYEPDEVSPEIGSNEADEEAEDDELMIGAGDDLSFGASELNASPTQRQATTKTATNKKRKLKTAVNNSSSKTRRKTNATL